MKNLDAAKDVRIRRSFRWRAASSVHPLTAELLGRFNAYARSAPRWVGMDPVAVRVEWSAASRSSGETEWMAGSNRQETAVRDRQAPDGAGT